MQRGSAAPTPQLAPLPQHPCATQHLRSHPEGSQKTKLQAQQLLEPPTASEADSINQVALDWCKSLRGSKATL